LIFWSAEAVATMNAQSEMITRIVRGKRSRLVLTSFAVIIIGDIRHQISVMCGQRCGLLHF
jgi:hypothetical protein